MAARVRDREWFRRRVEMMWRRADDRVDRYPWDDVARTTRNVLEDVLRQLDRWELSEWSEYELVTEEQGK